MKSLKELELNADERLFISYAVTAHCIRNFFGILDI